MCFLDKPNLLREALVFFCERLELPLGLLLVRLRCSGGRVVFEVQHLYVTSRADQTEHSRGTTRRQQKNRKKHQRRKENEARQNAKCAGALQKHINTLWEKEN